MMRMIIGYGYEAKEAFMLLDNYILNDAYFATFSTSVLLGYISVFFLLLVSFVKNRFFSD